MKGLWANRHGLGSCPDWVTCKCYKCNHLKMVRREEYLGWIDKINTVLKKGGSKNFRKPYVAAAKTYDVI